MAHIKILTPDSQDFSEPVAQLIKLANGKLLGSDRSAFIKRASTQFIDKMASLEFRAGEVPVHLIAMGAHSRYGCNRNGDSFTEEVCRKYHPTFVKHARAYRDHQNKDKSKSYGIVKASAYNEEMHRVELIVAYNGTKEAADRNGGLVADEELEKLASDTPLGVSMACVTDPEYPVLTRDRGYVGIADIQIGDYVWTHAGNWRRVHQLNRRRYTGEVYTFRANGMPIKLELTADHPMWAKVFSGSREESAINAKARRYFTDPTAFEKEPSAWYHASHVGVGDRFFYKPITRYSNYSKIDSQELATVMGYYLAEGSFGYNGEKACTVQFTCNMSDSLPRRLPGLIEAMYPDVNLTVRPKTNSKPALDVCVHSTEFAEFLRMYVGRGCKRKFIPPEIMNASRAVQLAFLGAWLDGDGWVDKKGGHWTTSNMSLVLQGRDILAMLGIPAAIYLIDHTNCSNSGYANSGVEYTLNVAHLDLWNLSEFSEKVASYPTPTQKRTRPASMRLCLDGTYAYRISEVTTRYVADIETYNFEVEEDESYSLGGFISHNCRVSKDICSGCGNEARTRAEYCGPELCKYGGCKDNLAKTFDDGTTLSVFNPDPTFFDISKVFRPADRIAYTLGIAKKASDYYELMKEAQKHYGAEYGSSAIAEKLGVTPPLWAMADGPWTNPYVVAQLKTASDLACFEETLSGDSAYSPQDLAFSEVVQPVHTDLPDARSGLFKLSHIVSALAEERCLLPLANFLALLSGHDNVKTAAEQVAERLPGVYSRLSLNPALENELQHNPYRPTVAPQRVRQWVQKHASEWSLSRPHIMQRMQLAMLRQPKTPTRRPLTKIATTVAADELAKHYALYQLGFLTAVSGDSDSQRFRELAVRSNFVRA